MADAFSAPRTTKARRGRPPTPRLQALDAAIVDLIEDAEPPVTVRQTYYMSVAAGLISKDTDPRQPRYKLVQRRMLGMRLDGRLPWSWVADNTRWVREPNTWPTWREAVADMHSSYRRSYWYDQPFRLELWVESDSIASFVHQATTDYQVPLYVCRGQASITYVHQAAQDAQRDGRPVHVLYVGDWDPTGLQVDASVEERYRRFGGASLDLTVNRIAVTAQQIRDLNLTSGPAKTKDSNYKRFVARCQAEDVPVAAVETEALPPAILRQVVREAIWAYVDPVAWELNATVERSELDLLARMRDGTWPAAPDPEWGNP